MAVVKNFRNPKAKKQIEFYNIWNIFFIFALSNGKIWELLRKHKLIKLKNKNRGNTQLIKAIDKLIAAIENANWTKQTEIKEARPDCDCVHSDGFYFFDINIHRTMVLIVFEDSEATVIWTGSHEEYEKTFKGNKTTIEKWLRGQQLI